MSYKIETQWDSDGHHATVPAFPEIHSHGDSYTGVMRDAEERIPYAIASRKARGVDVPEEDG